QVKSCLLLAGLFADGPTTVIEPGPARDHTERMLRAMGAEVQVDGARITITPGQTLQALDLIVPGDISSAAFLLVAACANKPLPLTPSPPCSEGGSTDASTPPLHAMERGPGGEVNSTNTDNSVYVENVGINPTRTGILDILQAMGAEVELTNERDAGGEPVADLIVKPAQLHGTTINNTAIGGEVIVRAIDEFPALMVAALTAEGATIVRDAKELRVKETDRIAVMAAELRKLGAEIEEFDDGFRVIGPQTLHGAVVQGHDDHRVAMALAVAGLIADGETIIEDAGCVEDSFPGFVETLRDLGADVEWLNND
ncbi:MAG: 3-phosphoshikimate 1-carboxyvinyltransferase, partial [Anaerolineae bacterium]|nr:3-phosphoshikimate 1-carboxyvinyltransferase [Anaerolineae bacterium]